MRVRALFLVLARGADRRRPAHLRRRRRALRRPPLCRRRPRVPPSPTGATLADGTRVALRMRRAGGRERDGGVRRRRTRVGARSEERPPRVLVPRPPTRVVRVRPAGRPRAPRRPERPRRVGGRAVVAARRPDADRVRLGAPARARGGLRVAERGAREAVHGHRQGRAAVDVARWARTQSIAYHPSGLALGFIVDEGQRQGIWLSSNEGKDPQRLVFSRPDTTFSSVAFSPDGTRIFWIAQHAGARERDPLDGPRGSFDLPDGALARPRSHGARARSSRRRAR